MLLYRLVFVLLSFYHVHALNILIIFSLPLRSHYMSVKPLFDELARRGHHVTVVNNFPEKSPVENLTYVHMDSPMNDASKMLPIYFYESIDTKILYLHNYYKHLKTSPPAIRKDCNQLFKVMRAEVNLKNTKYYDVIFVEQFLSDCGLVYAAAHYDAPIIGIMSHVLLPWTYSRIGLNFNYATDSFYFSNAGHNPTVFKQLEAVLLDTIFNTIGKWTIYRSIYDVFQTYMPEYKFDVDHIAKERMKMVFSYQHFSLTGGRILAPQLLEIGGIHIKESKPLNKEIEDFIDASKHGVIYVSFGSNLKSITMSENKLRMFLNAFEKIPQNVIFKWENESLPSNSKKIFTKSWFSQVDILCHPKVIGFVSHGGMLGTSEAAHCGVPMVVFPFFGDQFSNAAFIAQSGLGHSFYLSDTNEEDFLGALKEVTSDKMQKRAKEISSLWHDRPFSAMDSAIYWTEYVARHRTSPPSLPAKSITIFDRILLDGALIILFCLLPIYLLFILCKIILKLVKAVLCKQKRKTE